VQTNLPIAVCVRTQTAELRGCRMTSDPVAGPLDILERIRSGLIPTLRWILCAVRSVLSDGSGTSV
jgi:hypothetical protein